jgi:hypothetical protein
MVDCANRLWNSASEIGSSLKSGAFALRHPSGSMISYPGYKIGSHSAEVRSSRVELLVWYVMTVPFVGVENLSCTFRAS